MANEGADSDAVYFPDYAPIAAICFRAHHAAFRFGYEAVAE